MPDVTTASPALMPFTSRHEGRVHKAYRDCGGRWTIGDGFTMLSVFFAGYWKKTHGHALRAGDTISDAECDLLLGKLIAAEFALPVAKRFAGTGIRQHEFDAATDLSFNCGSGSLKWSWAALLAGRKVREAAQRLLTTAITASNKVVAGLQRRRADQAHLMETGDYGTGAASVSETADEIRAYQQQLVTLGLYKGLIDGQAGATSITAVKTFQGQQGLVADGVVGPATRAALKRAVEVRVATQAAGGTATGGAAVGGASQAAHQAGQIDWHTLLTALAWGLAIGAAILVAFMLWRYRGVILRRRMTT